MPGHIGRFKILKTIGRGGTASTKLAIDTETDKRVAIKVYRENLDDHAEDLIEREIEISSQFDHPNLVRFIDEGTDDYIQENTWEEVRYLVLELAHGGELYDFIGRSGSFSEPVARYYMKQILEGVQYIHNQGFIHRDLKAGNLFLNP